MKHPESHKTFRVIAWDFFIIWRFFLEKPIDFTKIK